MTVTALPLGDSDGDGDWHVPADAPVAAAGRLPDGADQGSVSRFGDDIWDLSPLARREHEPGRRINWASFPPVLHGSVKRAGWALITLPTPEALLERAATSRVEHPSTGTIAAVTQQWRRYATWLAARGITGLAEVDAACHDEWAAHLARLPVSNQTCGRALDAVSTLWGYAPHLPPGDRIPMPPWEADGTRDYLPAEDGRNENATAPIHPAVMSPLLVWALRFTEDFAPDILAALAEQQRLRSRIATRHSPDAAARLAALLGEHARTGTPLPGETIKGRRSAARSYLAGVTGASITQVQNAVRRAQLPVADAAPLDIAITGTVHGRPWISQISYHQATALALRLAAACLVVVAYLSGQWPAEVLHLRTGCCPAPVDDGSGTVRYRLHGHHFKGVRDADGTPAPGGAERQWTVIPPVHTAIGILEQLTTSGHLFPLKPAWLDSVRPRTRRRRPPASPGPGEAGAAPGRSSPPRRPTAASPSSSPGSTPTPASTGWTARRSPPTRTARLLSAASGERWTLAWHIARRPGGVIAGALQYRHQAIQLFEGYAGTSDSGFRAEVESEQAIARGEHLLALIDQHDHGPLTGPAADEALRRLEELGEHQRLAGQVVTDPRRLQRLMKRHDPAIYPGKYVTCVYSHAKALCGGDSQPDLASCQPLRCRNVALTPGNRDTLAEEIASLDAALTAVPVLPPLLQHRLRDRRQAIADFLARNQPGPA